MMPLPAPYDRPVTWQPAAGRPENRKRGARIPTGTLPGCLGLMGVRRYDQFLDPARTIQGGTVAQR